MMLFNEGSVAMIVKHLHRYRIACPRMDPTCMIAIAL
jgi:hypothetical protein